MAIAGVDTQGGSQLTALRNTQQPSPADDARAQEAPDARFGTDDTSEAEARQDRFGTQSSPPPRRTPTFRARPWTASRSAP